MQGIIRAVARLLVMSIVMAAVLVASVFAGLGTTTAIAMGIVLAGLVGLVSVARRPARSTAHEEIAAMMAPAPPPPAAVPASLSKATAVEAMAPPATKAVDPEANMPRWRRPSLLEARRSDPLRQATVHRLPMRFSDDQSNGREVRIVRYAVVPLLDRPDEVLGLRLSDLESGDEVQVTGSSGAFLEVACPNGERGWVHRTTLAQAGPATLPNLGRPLSQEGDDALTALLSARGLI
jgi:hypothetical protein